MSAPNSTDLMVTALDAISATIGSLATALDTMAALTERSFRQHDAELAEIRDGIIDLDHRIASVAQAGAVRELRPLDAADYQRQLRALRAEHAELKGDVS